VGSRAGLERRGKSRPPPGFDPRTVQDVASRYTDYVTRPTQHVYLHVIRPITVVEMFNETQKCTREAKQNRTNHIRPTRSHVT
jgi:hypothetical protein